MKIFKRISIWWQAWTTSCRCWRVTYKDGKRTYPLSYSEAKGLRDVFNGKMWIDYDYS